MARNDPSDTGGLFIGRRPGTGPMPLRETVAGPERRWQRTDRVLAAGILAVETLLCLSLLGPQALGWLWIGSQVEYQTGALSAGISTVMLGCLGSLMLTVALANRLDHSWRIVRRAGGHRQEQGALETIFAVTVTVALVCFGFWFLIIEGPGPSLAPVN